MAGTTESSRAVARKGAGGLVLRVLSGVDTVIGKIEVVVVSASVMAMAVNSIANVIGRQFFGRSIFFAEELNSFLIIMITFIGASYAARHGRHIRMSALYDQLSDRLRRYLMVVMASLTAAVMFFLAYHAAMYLFSLAGFGRVTPALRVPIHYVYMFVPVGFALTGIQFALTAVRNLYSEQPYVSFNREDSYDEVEVSAEDKAI